MNVRLLLDEHLSPVIAEQLLARDINCAAVSCRPDLRTLGDPDILKVAAAEGRVVVTRNVADFVRLDAAWSSTGRRHPGILCVATRRFPESPALVGSLTTALADWARRGADVSGTYVFL